MVENPAGPLQLYVVPTTVLAVRVMVLPEQTGLLEPAVGVAGNGLTVIPKVECKASTYNLLTVPLQGSPKTPLVAATEKELRPIAAA